MQIQAKAPSLQIIRDGHQNEDQIYQVLRIHLADFLEFSATT